MEHEFRRTLKFTWEDIPYRPESFRNEGFHSTTKGSAPLQWRLYFKNEPLVADHGQRFCMYLEWVKHSALPELNVASASMKFFHKDGSDVLIHGLRKKKFSHTGNFAWADEEVRQRQFEDKYVRVRKSDKQRVFSVHVQICFRMSGCVNAFYTAIEEHKRCMQSYATDKDIRPIELVGVQPNGPAASGLMNGNTSHASACFDDEDIRLDEKKSFQLVTAPPVARNMLIRMAPVFATMLDHTNDMVESQTCKVNIVDFAPDIIAQLAEYCQNGPLRVAVVQHAIELVYLADKYEANGLVRLCAEAMKAGMTEDNVMKSFKTAVSLNLHDVRELCLEFLESPAGISKLDDFMDTNLKPNSIGDLKLVREISSYYAARTTQLKQKLKTCNIKVPKRLKLRITAAARSLQNDDRKRKFSGGGAGGDDEIINGEEDENGIAVIGEANAEVNGKRARFEDRNVFDINDAEPNSSDEEDDEIEREGDDDDDGEFDEDSDDEGEDLDNSDEMDEEE